MPFVVQLILPVYDNNGREFSPDVSKRVRAELTDKFAGLTAYTRAPAEGTWRDSEGRTQRDDVVIVEVMTATLDREWWMQYGRELAARFQQEELVVRATEFQDLTVRDHP
jgi:crotonobetainyl-CoA:carnitine CoA-transferase CaiB-like acyl-CoA transferase